MASRTEIEVVLQHDSMIECQVLRKILGPKYSHVRGVVARLRLPYRLGNINDRGRVSTGVAGRIGIATQGGLECDWQGGFLLGLPHRRVLRGLADIDETTRNRPAVGRVPATNEDHRPSRTVAKFDDDIYGQSRRYRCIHADFQMESWNCGFAT